MLANEDPALREKLTAWRSARTAEVLEQVLDQEPEA
jgi:phosphoribosylcarboxyaminoimidazole (NCAIR) mutase